MQEAAPSITKHMNDLTLAELEVLVSSRSRGLLATAITNVDIRTVISTLLKCLCRLTYDRSCAKFLVRVPTLDYAFEHFTYRTVSGSNLRATIMRAYLCWLCDSCNITAAPGLDGMRVFDEERPGREIPW